MATLLTATNVGAMLASLTTAAQRGPAWGVLAQALLALGGGSLLLRRQAQAGFTMAPWAIFLTAAAAAALARGVSERYPPGPMGGIALLLSAGLASLALLTPAVSTTAILLHMALRGLGFGLFQSPNLKPPMSPAPPEHSGGASAMVPMPRFNRQAIGATLVAGCFGIGFS